MANRVPLIINTTANQIQELALGDCLDLTASGIHNAGVITATKFVGDGSLLTNVSGGGGASGISDIVEDTTPQLGGNLDINGNIINGSGSIVITGGIQASSFTGPLIGNVTGNVTGNADTATTATTATTANTAGGLTGNPAIQVASVVATGHIQADTVSVASTLTYEDVTNIDSIGIVTARTGIKVLAGGIDAVGNVSATSFSGDGSALTNLPSDVVNDTTPQLGGDLDLNGKSILGTTNIKVDAPSGAGVQVMLSNNALAGNGSTPDVSVLGFAAGGALKASIRAAVYGEGWMSFHNNNDTEKLRITAAGQISQGTTIPRERVHFHYDSSDENYLRFTNSTTGTDGADGFNVGLNSAEQALIWNKENTDMLFGTNGSTALTIDTSQNSTFAGDINLSEGKKTIFGSNSGSGAYIKHQSGHLEIKNETGNLYWDNLGSIRIRTQTGGTYTNKLEITSDKIMPSVDFKPHAHHSLDIGTASNAFRDIYGQTITVSTAYDSKGELRSIPFNQQTSSYTPVAADAGKVIYTNSGVTINNSVFSAGDVITIVNYSGSDITITQGSGININNTADATTGNRTLAASGMCTIWFRNASEGWISGAGLS